MGERFQFILRVAAVMAALQAPAAGQEKNAAPPPAGAPAQGPVAPGPAPPAPAGQPSPNQDGKPGSDDRRFVFHPIDGGVLRLDMATGAVAACTPDGTAWNCVAARDERTALDREIARLQRDNAVLKNALVEHGVALPDGMAPNPPAGAAVADEEPVPRPPQTVPPTPAAPGTPAPGADSAFDQIVDAAEKGWRRLVEMMTDLRRYVEQ